MKFGLGPDAYNIPSCDNHLETLEWETLALSTVEEGEIVCRIYREMTLAILAEKGVDCRVFIDIEVSTDPHSLLAL